MRTEIILIVEDDENLRQVTKIQLDRAGYHTTAATDVPQALAFLSRSPVDLVITDMNLPGQSGLDLLKKIRSDYPETPVVIFTGYGTVATAVDAMKLGAFDYLTKPVHPYELKALVNRALERRRLLEEVSTLRSNIDRKFGFENFVGHSSGLLEVLDAASRAAHTDATVLIRGETGTGKDLLAKAIHFNSARAKKPFVVINCGAISHDLLESELFGYVKGAFTGAFVHKKGKVETADGGTLFLDEIGDMPSDLQVRILRLIQEREIEKVGGTVPIPIDVRIIAATHRDLEALVSQGTFREDLYYRLAVVPINVPTLRQRAADIPEFVVEFFRQSTQKYNRTSLRLPQNLIPRFSAYAWPGNVRQLQNAIERMVVLCPGKEITEADLPEFLHSAIPAEAPPKSDIQVAEGMTLDAIEKHLIVRALKKFEGNQSQAARYLGVTRKTLLGRIAKHGLGKEPISAEAPDMEQWLRKAAT
jgi:two-component system NtrC family response regulator